MSRKDRLQNAGGQTIIQPAGNQKPAMVERTVVTSFQGILPPPDMLAQYGQIITDGANRIVAMAEHQQAHRMELEKMNVASQLKQGERGQLFGLIIAVVALGISGIVTYMGHDKTGAVIGGSTVLGLASIFALGKYQIRKSLSAKTPPGTSSPR